MTALQGLRALKRHIPVIMLTGDADEQVDRTALRWGAVDYIAKPFESAHLLRLIEAAVAHGEG